MPEMYGCGCVGLPAPAPACMCGVEGSRPQPLTQASALKETESGEARAALTIKSPVPPPRDTPRVSTPLVFCTNKSLP